MGMCGYYIAVDSETSEKIKNNELNAFDFMYGGKSYDEENYLDIDKSWHALAYMLSEISGDDEDLRYAVPLDEENEPELDIPIFKLNASRVVKVAEAVNKVTREKLLQNYDIDDMLEFNIYPLIDGENEEEFFEYIYCNFVNMQEFLSKAAKGNKSIIFCVV